MTNPTRKRTSGAREFRLTTIVRAPADVCFDLSRSIDLHLESMERSRERAVAGVTSGLIGLDEEVTWEARHFGRLWRVTSQITAFDRPRRFVDEMTQAGPFSSFRHVHSFEEEAGRTRMVDVVEFRTRYGPLADCLADVYLRRLMRTRNGMIREKAENGTKHVEL